ncbi:hypothetical protein PR001_g27641 [Phytophthora rubi]|uniref:Uncharacterized protein n=1 Tax=Phytophthora rubi TaxID=129364 RepID=A0A6A3HJW8_9STRA|nr:hypothetical protein PR001_g27641 [Phytophthora rubi]
MILCHVSAERTVDDEPAVDRVEYPTPRKILARPRDPVTTECEDAIKNRGRAVATCASRSGIPPAEGIPDAGLESDQPHVEICVDTDRPTEEASAAAGTPEALATTAEDCAVSGERQDDSAQSDDVSDGKPMRELGLQAEETPRFPAQDATKKIPLEGCRASASTPTPDTIPQGSPGQASEDPGPDPDP